ncbi:Mmadhc [Acrasis kona]|uniref:Mmadhc n=1 Tax=Acrasis kona TaxID=1008807 RepID=A0AAW2YRP6_9EUKA
MIFREIDKYSSAPKMKKSRSLVLGPARQSTSEDGEQILELTVHTCPSLLCRDLVKIFPDQAELFKSVRARSLDGNPKTSYLFVIPTFQPTWCDMLEFTPESEHRKDFLLNTFMQFARELCEKLGRLGCWADFADPVTGYPMNSTQGGILYSDVDACELLLKYKIELVCNTCRIVSHPEWKTSVYPATCFAVATLEQIQSVLLDMGISVK